MGRNTSLDERKSASGAADELVSGTGRRKSHIIRVIEGFKTVMFRSKFDSWPQTIDATVSEDGQVKVAGLACKRSGKDSSSSLLSVNFIVETATYFSIHILEKIRKSIFLEHGFGKNIVEVDKIYLRTPTKIAILDHEKKRTFVSHKDGLPDAGDCFRAHLVY